MATPITPIMIEAPTRQSLEDAGYEVAWLAREPEDLGIPEDDDGPTGEAIIAEWEPPKPDGDGWVLHSKDWTEDASIGAVWARPSATS